MSSKILKKMECQLGFIQIPSRVRSELIGDSRLPCFTTLNGFRARIDKYGRLWSSYLKERFPVGTVVGIIKKEEGYHVFPMDTVKDLNSSMLEQKDKIAFVSFIKEGNMKASTIKPYFKYNSITIFNDDILKTEAIDNNSIDLIVTSPPYDVDIKYENYDDSIPYDKYLEFTRNWLKRCYDFAKDDGRFCLNIPLDKNKGGQQSVCADITTIAKEVGWKYHATIIWNEQNISRRTAWGSWMSASAPFVIAPVEVIIVLYKKEWKKKREGKSDITREEFIEWTNAVWNFSGENRRKIGHPSPFPIELPRRCIKLFSFVGDTVLDPFLGSGTTLIACLQTNRIGIGVEIDKKYCDLAVKRLREYGITQQKLDEVLQTTSPDSNKL
jgi:site-specific DNA-methyltransferase (adenine-specific)